MALDVGGDVLEHLGGDDPVELAVGEGQRQRVALLDVGLGTGGHLARVAHRGEQLAHGGELVGVLVEGDDVGAAAVHLEGVAAGAAAHVEHALARAEPESVEVNGQHGRPPRWSGGRGDAASRSATIAAGAYAAAVASATARQLNSSCDAAAAGCAHPRAALGVVEQGGRGRSSSSPTSPGVDQVGAVAVRADDLGDRPGAADATSGVSQAISSAVGSEKPS